MPSCNRAIALAGFAFLGLAAPALAAPQAISVHSGWGAFRDGKRCYAIAEAEPSTAPRDLDPFASVSLAPDAPALQVQLSRLIRSGSAVTLQVGNRRFRLSGEGGTATSRDVERGGSKAILAALREADTMTVHARDRRSRYFRDIYALAGAPTAIDAALIVCGRPAGGPAQKAEPVSRPRPV